MKSGMEERKRMKTAIKFPQELMTSIDMMNTLNGGTSQPMVRLQKFQTHHQILIRVPGIMPENVKIEVNNNQLMIYYFTPILSQEKELKFPRVLYNDTIPYFVDVNTIGATEEDSTLVVKLPFNEFSDGYHRDISLGQN
jgi:HSP20 family molecular chaperone IbpA